MPPLGIDELSFNSPQPKKDVDFLNLVQKPGFRTIEEPSDENSNAKTMV